MQPILFAIMFFATFGAGLAAGIAVMKVRIRSTEYLKSALERARMQGRLERDESRGSIEPPKPWMN